jgi:hypothetical protein
MDSNTSSGSESEELEIDFYTIKHMGTKEWARFNDVHISEKIGDVFSG